MKPNAPSARETAWRIFRWPAAVGVASLVGLVSALVGDGWYDAFSWLLLGGAVLLIVVLLLRPARR